MSLRDLVEGDCGRPNSLVNLTSHFLNDQAHKDEGLRQVYEPSDAFTSSNQLVQEYLGEALAPPPQSFCMDSLLQEMREIESSVSMHAPVPAPGVAVLATTDPAELVSEEDSVWADQYLESGKHFEEKPRENEIWDVMVDEMNITPGTSSGEVFELGFGPKWAEDYLEISEQSREFDQNWMKELQIINNSGNEIQETAKQLVQSVNDPKINYSKFMKFMQLVGDGEIKLEDGKVISTTLDGVREIEEEEEGKIISANDVSDVAEDWLEEFQKKGQEQLTSGTGSGEVVDREESGEDSSQMWSKLKRVWEDILKPEDPMESPWIVDYSEYFDPRKEYEFEKDNPMKDNNEALEEGKRRLKASDLSSAILCFEAAVTSEPSNVEAWELLGRTQAENEQDPQAIAALLNCLKLDGGNLRALMALAISYTNESFPNQACIVLKEWLKENPEYKHFVSESSKEGNLQQKLVPVPTNLMSHETHNEVRDLYIAAARLHPSDPIDPDVQCGLGVLFNLSNEYSKAVDCFKAALQVRQNDYQIWNRLGATLANGNRPEEAVDAYHHALQLSPGYTRARYNLGITCLNLGAHREAVEHLLTALNLQSQVTNVIGAAAAAESVMSDTVWSTLRLTLSVINRKDLFEYLDSRNLQKLNEEFGIEV